MNRWASLSNAKPINHQIGDIGEDIATAYLLKKGYQIRARNYRVRAGEVDIVAADPNGEWVFVEVKSFKPRSMITGLDAVGFPKQKRLILAAKHYLLRHKAWEHTCRFDVIEVKNGVVIEHIQNAFQT